MRRNRSVIPYALLTGATALVMLVFAYNTSPLFEYIGADSGMYLVIGRAMTRGTKLYSGLFDHKGPLIFVFNMLPQLLIRGTLGVWLAEVSMMAASAGLLYGIARRRVGNILSLCAPLVYLWITASLFNGGNYTEEYSNFFCVIALCVFDRWLDGPRLSRPMAYILGLCLAAVFFFRPNNIAFIVAMILFIGIQMLRKRQKGVPAALLFGFLGIATVALPLAVWHLCAGTLCDMLYATVLHNLKYCAVGATNFHLLPTGNGAQLTCFFVTLLVILDALCASYSKSENAVGSFLLLSLGLVCAAILVGGRSFMYYWTLLAPLCAYASIFALKNGIAIKKKPVRAAALSLAVTLMLLNCFQGARPVEKRALALENAENASQLYAQIPDGEKDDCFGYNISAIFIYGTDMSTPCRYFTMQSWMSRTNPDIGEYCAEYVRTETPGWILSYFGVGDMGGSGEVMDILREDYTEMFRNDCGCLYRRTA